MQAYQAVYVHIPFCKQKCVYCDFVSYGQMSRETMEVYTASLCDEIKRRARELPVAADATIYFGGGTPSILPVSAIAQIVAALKETGLWRNPREATIEANPGTVDFAKLVAYRELGFDRLSVGVQSLVDNELKAMGRVHDSRTALDALQEARRAGFGRVSADLIYGFTGQTVTSIAASLQLLAAQDIDHISVYGLSVEKGTPLYEALQKGEDVLPAEQVNEEMYDLVMDYLPRQGFKRYEISNFAKAGQESRHNLVYWHYLPYLGLGAGACSFDGKRRLNNVPSLKKYCAGAAAEIEELTGSNIIGEYMFMGLRIRDGVKLAEARERLGIDIMDSFASDIKRCMAQGLLEMDGESLRLTQRGMKLGNQVFEIFL